ncbi:MAG: AAA family ATPase, partial [Bacteroidaceae bacterium]
KAMNSIPLITEALGHAGEDTWLAERMQHLEHRRITPDTVLPQMEFLFRFSGMPCFPRGELVGLTGRPKSGKTFVCSILMSLCFRSEVLTLVRGGDDALRVLWYDTEQSDESTQDILCNRIMPMIGAPETLEGMHLFEGPDEAAPFQVFNVRRDSWQERLPLLEAAVDRCRPDMVILDGIRDLVNDINDGVLAQDTVERLMHLASAHRCCMVCILHQNKSAEDNNLRGWIGTELTHKAFEVYECTKGQDRIFTFGQKLTRKYDIIDTLRYVVDEHGIPRLAGGEGAVEGNGGKQLGTNQMRTTLNLQYVTGWNGRHPFIDVAALFRDALPEEGRLYQAREMQTMVMGCSGITSPHFYNRLREQAILEGIVVKTTDGNGFVAYKRPAPAAPPQPVQQDLFGASPGDAPF